MQETEIATLIKWTSNIDPKRIERWLEKLEEEGHIEYANTQSYDPEYCFPTLYFP